MEGWTRRGATLLLGPALAIALLLSAPVRGSLPELLMVATWLTVASFLAGLASSLLTSRWWPAAATWCPSACWVGGSLVGLGIAGLPLVPDLLEGLPSVGIALGGGLGGTALGGFLHERTSPRRQPDIPRWVQASMYPARLAAVFGAVYVGLWWPVWAFSLLAESGVLPRGQWLVVLLVVTLTATVVCGGLWAVVALGPAQPRAQQLAAFGAGLTLLLAYPEPAHLLAEALRGDPPAVALTLLPLLLWAVTATGVALRARLVLRIASSPVGRVAPDRGCGYGEPGTPEDSPWTSR